MATKWHRFAIDVPKKFKPKDRVLVAEKVIDSILKRTIDKGRDKDNKKFPAYTKAYAKKKGQRRVDLVLSFEMMSSLHMISHKPGRILVGMPRDKELNAKVEGNITGSYGKKPDANKARNFMGVPAKALNAIIEIVGADIPEKK